MLSCLSLFSRQGQRPKGFSPHLLFQNHGFRARRLMYADLSAEVSASRFPPARSRS